MPTKWIGPFVATRGHSYDILLFSPGTHPLNKYTTVQSPGKDDEEMKEEKTSLWSSSSIHSPIHPMNMMSTGKGLGGEEGERGSSASNTKPLLLEVPYRQINLFSPDDLWMTSWPLVPHDGISSSMMIAFMKSMRFVSSCHDRNLKEEILHCIEATTWNVLHSIQSWHTITWEWLSNTGN